MIKLSEKKVNININLDKNKGSDNDGIWGVSLIIFFPIKNYDQTIFHWVIITYILLRGKAFKI